MPEYLHVNVNRLRSNRKRIREGAQDIDLEPVCTAKPNRHATGVYGNRIAILDARGEPVAHLIYDPQNPLPCGAVAYVEANYGARVVG